jgi:hypothetical protein
MNWLRAFFIRERIALLFAAAVALLILWTMLLPGYILSLDLVFGPHYFIGPLNTGGFINSLPISLLLKGLYYILPGWVIEKIMLLALFFIIPYFSYKFLPVPKKVSVQIFAALIYTANLFVYDRMLAGQWLVLYSYAFFPLFLHYLFKTTEKPSFRNNFILVFLSAVIGIFSLQFFVLTLVTTYVWLHIWTVNTLRKKEYADFGAIFIRGLACSRPLQAIGGFLRSFARILLKRHLVRRIGRHLRHRAMGIRLFYLTFPCSADSGKKAIHGQTTLRGRRITRPSGLLHAQCLRW